MVYDANLYVWAQVPTGIVELREDYFAQERGQSSYKNGSSYAISKSKTPSTGQSCHAYVDTRSFPKTHSYWFLPCLN